MKVNNEINKKKEKKSKMADLFVAQVQKDLSEGKYKKLKRIYLNESGKNIELYNLFD